MSEWVEEQLYYGLMQFDQIRTDGVRYQIQIVVGWVTTQDTAKQFVSKVLESCPKFGHRYRGSKDNIIDCLNELEEIKFRCSTPYHVGNDPEKELIPPNIWLEGWKDITKEEYEQAKKNAM